MASQSLSTILQHLRHSVRAREGAAVPDCQLLHRWTKDRDEAAFELLVRRHGPMVFAVCRRVLGHTQDAEDAFQATFLVLVRKAGSIHKRTALGSWLHKVAYRVALRARTQQRSVVHDAAELEQLAAPGDESVLWRDVRAVLDEEVSTLPAHYREAFVLCYLQGKTNEEAASALGCPLGTVLSRLARARELLRGRLRRRGLALSATALVVLVSRETAGARLPSALLAETVRISLFYGGGSLMTGAVTTQATTLCEGVLRTMFLTKIKIAATLVLTLGLIGGGSGLLLLPSPAQERGDSGPGDGGFVPVLEKRQAPQLALTLKSPQSPVLSLAYAPDGQALITGLENGKIHIWDPNTGQKTRTFNAHATDVTAVAFSPDGRTLASSGKDGKVIVWQPRTGKRLFEFNNGRIPVNSLAISPDGRHLVTGSNNDTIRILDAMTGREIMRLRGPGNSITSLAVSPDGRFVASGGKNEQIKFWDFATGKQLWATKTKKFHTLDVSPDGRHLATGTKDGRVVLFDLRTGRLLRRFAGHKGTIFALKFSPDGRWLATAGDDKSFRLWDVQKGLQIFMGLHQGPVTTLAFSPDGKHLVTGSKDHTVRVWILFPPPAKQKLPRVNVPADRLSQLVQNLLTRKISDDKCIEALYLATLARFPTPGETTAMRRERAKNSSRQVWLRNIVFALTTSREFSRHLANLKKRDTQR